MRHIKNITVVKAEVTPDAISALVAAIFDLIARITALLDKA